MSLRFVYEDDEEDVVLCVDKTFKQEGEEHPSCSHAPEPTPVVLVMEEDGTLTLEGEDESSDSESSLSEPVGLDVMDGGGRDRHMSYHCFGHGRFVCEEVVYVCQILLIFIVVLLSGYNLCVGSGRMELWTALLSSCLGYILPHPRPRLHY